jgi:Fe-S-cluster containining protein
MTDLHEPVKCGTCTACCRASSGVVLQPPDVLNAYDYIMAPATAELAAKLQRTNPGALLPLEELPDAPADFLQICKQVGARFAVAELSQHDNGDCVYLGDGGCTIYDRRPAVCRGFDCRRLFMSQSRDERRQWIKDKMVSRDVYAAARKRLKHAVS